MENFKSVAEIIISVVVAIAILAIGVAVTLVAFT